jgi:crossover junction endodeoxyribonuclease RuvC
VIVISADPGLKGAIAALKDGKQIVWLQDMPTKELSNGKRMICARQLTETLKQIMSEHPHEDFTCIIEKVSSRPGEGVVSAFTFGRGFGILEACIIARGLPLDMVPPQTWKASMRLTSDKDDVRIKMIKQFPQLQPMLKRKMDDGRAEAIAIALYLWKRDYA